MLRRLLLLHPSRLEGENRGVYEQHVSSALRLLGSAPGWEVHALDLTHPAFPQAALAAELVIVHMLAAPEIEAVIRLRRARGLATIYEISDNFLDIGSWLPPGHSLRSPLVRQRLVHHASIADAVQVYASGLAELCRHVHDRVLQVDPYVPLPAVRERGGDFVVGWGGTTSHERDLAMVVPVIADFCRRHDDVTFAFMGNRAMGERLFNAIPSRQLRMREFSDHEEYLAFVSTWHAGLAPLQASAFNAGRTDTKAATYAACGVVPVLEDCELHRPHAPHAVLYRGAEELGSALEALYVDRLRAESIASRARLWAEEVRGADRLRAQRIALYEPLAPRETGEPLAIDDGEAVVPPDDVEALRVLVRSAPGYAQARLALAEVMRVAGDETGALELLDARPFPEVLAGVAAERQHALALRVCPERAEGYASRIESPAARVRVSHRGSDRARFLRALLEEQPFDYIALSTRIRELLASDGDRSELADICARACLVAPEIVPVELRPQSLVRFLPS